MKKTKDLGDETNSLKFFSNLRMSLGAENKTGMMKQETGCMKRHLQSGYKKVEKEPFLESG